MFKLCAFRMLNNFPTPKYGTLTYALKEDARAAGVALMERDKAVFLVHVYEKGKVTAVEVLKRDERD